MSFSGGYMVFEHVETLPTWTPQLSFNFQLKDTATADPSSDTITCASNHDQVDREVVIFTTTGTLPAPLIPFHMYRVVGTITATTFQVSDNDTWPTVSIIDITNAGTGVHTLWIRPLEIIATIAGVDTTNNILAASNRTFFHSDATESDRIRFQGASLPPPLVGNIDYWVAYGPTDFTFKVAVGGGGGSIVDLTGGGSGNILSIRGTTTVQYPGGDLGMFILDSAFMMAGVVQIIGGGGGGAAGARGEPMIVEVPRPTIKVRDPELASVLRRARRAARTIENLTIVGASGDSESGFALND
jgi:hypothetical protein